MMSPLLGRGVDISTELPKLTNILADEKLKTRSTFMHESFNSSRTLNFYLYMSAWGETKNGTMETLPLSFFRQPGLMGSVYTNPVPHPPSGFRVARVL